MVQFLQIHGVFFDWPPLLTHCGLVMPYGNIDLGHHWFRKWLVTWQHQAITLTNVDLSSSVLCGIHQGPMSYNTTLSSLVLPTYFLVLFIFYLSQRSLVFLS